MANIDIPHLAKQTTAARSKWSDRRAVGFALAISAALWTLIFWIAKALLV